MFKKLSIITLLITLLVPRGADVIQGQDMTPQFERVEACFVALPLGLGLGERTECGYVTVPENRDDPDNDRMIRLAVVVIHPLSKEPLPDPVMYLDGGPGGSVMNGLIQGGYYMVQPILNTGRSVILVAQRGVYPSEPVLECDSIYSRLEARSGAPQRDVLNNPNNETLDAYRAAWSGCLEDLAQLADLSAYYATAMAADVNDIRQALGYEQINLWGLSYGTRLGLTILRDYPDRIRVAILDSVYPPDVDMDLDLYANAEATLDRLFNTCASDAQCREIVPDLRATFFEAVTMLNAEPIVVTREDVVGGETLRYVVTGWHLASIAIYADNLLLPYVPKIILEASEGRFVEAMRAVRPGWPEPYTVHLPLSEIVACNEEASFYTTDDIRAAATALPVYAALLGVLSIDICALGNFRPPPLVENEPVSSEVPTLLLTGEFDATTPPRWAEQAAVTLDNAFVYTFPRATHATVFVGPCFYDIIRDFLNDPTTAPDTSCLRRREQQFYWAETLPSRQP